jgi:ribose/xylose/arabinose/galactoside ABC-type transport system permease subunit
MRGLLPLATAVFVIVAVAAAAVGVWLVTTVDREFAPRGTVGTLSLILAAILGGVSFATWRRSH